ncbi:MAG: RNA-binding protein [Pseudomonadota bacterium]
MSSEQDKNTSDINRRTVYIKNLSYQLGEKELKAIFSNFGVVKSVKVIIDFETLRSKGMAFIEMKDPAAAQRAIKGLNDKHLEGRTAKASLATPKKGRSLKLEIPKVEIKKVIKKNAEPNSQRVRKEKRKSSLQKMFENLKRNAARNAPKKST